MRAAANGAIHRIINCGIVLSDWLRTIGNTACAMESIYRSRKLLIVTTNLTLEELQNPEDTAHARIYDRLTEMCCPVCITGENFRKDRAREKMEQLKTLLNGKEICL